MGGNEYESHIALGKHEPSSFVYIHILAGFTLCTVALDFKGVLGKLFYPTEIRMHA